MFRTILIALIALIAAMPPTQAAPEKLILGHIGVSGSTLEWTATAVITEIERWQPGRFAIENKGGSTLGGEVDIWEGVKLGTVDLAIVTAAANENRDLTDTEAKAFDDGKTEVRSLDRQIERAEFLAEDERRSL